MMNKTPQRDLSECTICRQGQLCKVCRDTASGADIRQLLQSFFVVPGGVSDFECPHGKPWGYTPSAAEQAILTERLKATSPTSRETTNGTYINNLTICVESCPEHYTEGVAHRCRLLTALGKACVRSYHAVLAGREPPPEGCLLQTAAASTIAQQNRS